MEVMDIKFHEINLEDRVFVMEKLAEDDKRGCEYTFANNFVWKNVYQVEVAKMHGCAVIRFRDRKQQEVYYSYPIGAGDKKAVIEDLFSLCRKDGHKLCLSGVLESDRRRLMEWFPGKFLIAPNRDGYDYIYLREKLANLTGKKLHSKRNHIARFKERNDWSYETLTGANLEECRQMAYRWKEMNAEKWDADMEEELGVLKEALDHFCELRLCGGVLRNEGEVIAFCIGEPLNSDTFIVHFEKAYSNIQGAYPMINQQFAQSIGEKYVYINREEDTGNLGLRKAKLSYYPEVLLKKYTAAESHVVYADRKQDENDIINLWHICFGDEERDILFYLEHRMTEDNMLAIYEDGKLVSMASFLPTEYYLDGKYEPARYVYAVATLPEYRGRGYASEILKFAGEWYGELLILAPAEKSLCEYYSKMGFVSVFSKEEWSISKDKIMKQPLEEDAECCIQKNNMSKEEGKKIFGKNDAAGRWETAAMCRNKSDMISLETITPGEYMQIRDMSFEQEGYVRWDKKAVEYAMGFYGGRSGGICAVVRENESTRREQTVRDEKEILMYAIEDETLMIMETTLSQKELWDMAQELMEETGTVQMVYKRMGGMVWLPESKQDRPISPNGYLNLTLG